MERPAPAEVVADKKTKAELVAALQESFAICDAAFAALTISMISHSNEQHGYMAVYLRLKGIVPPSTEAMNMGR